MIKMWVDYRRVGHPSNGSMTRQCQLSDLSNNWLRACLCASNAHKLACSEILERASRMALRRQQNSTQNEGSSSNSNMSSYSSNGVVTRSDKRKAALMLLAEGKAILTQPRKNINAILASVNKSAEGYQRNLAQSLLCLRNVTSRQFFFHNHAFQEPFLIR